MAWRALALWLPLAAFAAAPVLGNPAPQDSVYLVPQRPACDPSTLEGEAVRFTYLSPEFNTPDSVVIAPWQRFAGEVAEDPTSVLARLDLARCLYLFIRDLRDDKRLAEVEQALDGALALMRADAARRSPPGAVATPPPYRTGRDVPVPERTRSRAPDYPAAAQLQQVTGIVFVEATIDASGNVRRTRVVGSIPPLDAAAEAAVRSWKYVPSMLNGKRVEVVHVAALRFSTAPESAADRIDIARFHYVRQERPAAEAALVRALDMVRNERARPDDLSAANLLDELSRGRRYSKDRNITAPGIVRQAAPKYTPQAMKQKITGSIEMEALVLSNGTIGAVRITKSLDPVFGLDVEAVRAAKQWRFRPATDAAGTPISVVVTLVMDFNLR